MDKNKILVIVLSVLIVVSFGFGYWMMFGDEPAKTHKSKKSKANVSHVVSKNTQSKVDISSFWSQGYIRSPFYSPAAEKQSKIVIQGIVKNIYGPDYKAMINGKMINIGQSIEGYEILNITSESVFAKNLKTQNEVELKVFE